MLNKTFPMAVALFALPFSAFAAEFSVSTDLVALNVPTEEGYEFYNTEAVSNIVVDPTTNKASVAISASVITVKYAETQDPVVSYKLGTYKWTPALKKVVAIPGLKREGLDLVFQPSNSERTYCGTYGTSALQGKPILYLSRKCWIDFKWIKKDSGEQVLKTYFNVK